MTFIFTELFGDTDRCRIVELLVENYKDELSLIEITEMADIIFDRDAQRLLNDLIDNDIVYILEYRENMAIYKLNIDNPICKMLVMLERTIVIGKLEGVIEVLPERLPNGLCKPIVMDGRYAPVTLTTVDSV